MEEINLEKLKKEFKEWNNRNVCIDIDTTVRTTLILKNCQIIITKSKLIIADSDNSDITIEIDPLPKLFKKNNRAFKIQYNVGDEIDISFFN